MALFSAHGRLQTCIQPVAYRVYWDLTSAAAHNSGLVPGRVQITGVVRCDNLFLALHAKKGVMDITSVTVGDAKATWVWSPVAAEDAGVVEPENDGVLRHHFETGEPLVVTLGFTMRLVARGAMQGLYVARTQASGVPGSPAPAPAPALPVLFATQFQPTSARRAFPCVDEPAAKAEFEVSVATPSGWVVLGNTTTASSSSSSSASASPPSTVVTTFAPTPRMSPYLVAVVAAAPGQLTCATTRTVAPAPAVGSGPPPRGPVAVRVWCRPHAGAAAATTTAAGVAAAALVFMETLTALPFTLHKLDLVSVDAFDSGAMENWGLMLFRPSAVLVRPDAPPPEREVVVSTVAHEVAHQWFGNLVTCAWWDELWLNEGFATLCAAWFQACNYSHGPPVGLFRAMHPSNPVWVKWVLNEGVSALHDRAVVGGPPVVSDADIAAQFDGATYNRSAAVLRMMVLVQGPQAAVAALRAYLRAASTDPGHHGCVTEAMLWAYWDPHGALGPQWMRVGGLVQVPAGAPSGVATTTADGAATVLPLVGATALGMGVVPTVIENLHGCMPAVIVHGPDWHPEPAAVALRLALQLGSLGTAAAMVVDAKVALDTASTPPGALQAALQVLRVATGPGTLATSPDIAGFAGECLRQVAAVCGVEGPVATAAAAKPKAPSSALRTVQDLVPTGKDGGDGGGGVAAPRADVLRVVWAAKPAALLKAMQGVLATGVAEEWLPGIMAWVLGTRVAEAQIAAQGGGSGSDGDNPDSVTFETALAAVSPMYVSEFMNGAADSGAHGAVLWSWLHKRAGWQALDHFAVGKFGVRSVAEVIVHAAAEAAAAADSGSGSGNGNGNGGNGAFQTGRACAHALRAINADNPLTKAEINALVATVLRKRAAAASIATNVCPLVAAAPAK
jgi:hypothetical protein